MLDINPYLSIVAPINTRAVDIAKELQVHSKGVYPDAILNVDRPNEDPRYKAYRTEKLIYTPITKSIWSRISATTDKIPMAEDWSIVFPDSEGVREGENLQDYTEKNYPYFDSLVNWFFTVGKKRMEDDPNSLFAVFPLSFNYTDREYSKPFVHIYPSECVIDYSEGEYCAILTKEKSWVDVGNAKQKSGRVYIFMTPTMLYKATQKGDPSKSEFDVFEKPHNIGYLPAFKAGGIIEEFENNQLIYHSFYSAVLPFFNEAIARYSDHQVNMMMHIHPDRWEIATTECKVCAGGGVNKRDQSKSCTACHGAGKLSIKTPFGITTVPAAKNGPTEFAPTPTPPMGYANRPIESIAFLKQEVKDNIQAGLDAINLGFINQTAEINSGVAKALDRQEMNAFFRNISRHIVDNVLRPAFFFINEWRYPLLTPQQREANMAKINIPTKFDILTSDALAARLKMAIESHFSPSIINSLQIEYAEKELGKDHEEVKKMKAISELDPLPNLTVTEKSELMLNPSASGTSVENYILSVNLSAFVARAINETKNFLDLDYAKQKAQLMKYVEEIKPAQAEIIPIYERGKAA